MKTMVIFNGGPTAQVFTCPQDNFPMSIAIDPIMKGDVFSGKIVFCHRCGMCGHTEYLDVYPIETKNPVGILPEDPQGEVSHGG